MVSNVVEVICKLPCLEWKQSKEVWATDLKLFVAYSLQMCEGFDFGSFLLRYAKYSENSDKMLSYLFPQSPHLVLSNFT